MKRSFWLLLILLFPLWTTVSAQDDAALNRFGVIEGFWLPDAVCELGAGWERIIFDWAQHQPTGVGDWNTLNVDERWLRAAQDCNREVIALLKSTPEWATDGSPYIGLPRGLYLPFDDPGNLWGNFVRRAAEYYAPFGVTRFIIWNEPDIEAGTYGYEFEGTLEDYAQMLKVAYFAAKSVNPAAHIHVAGTTYWHDVNEERRPYLDRLLEHLVSDPEAAANNYYFDGLTLHIYFRSETIYELVTLAHDLLEQYNLGEKAVWVMETNASPNLDPLWRVQRPVWQTNLEQQAAFLVQAAVLGLAADAERIGVYKFYDWNLPPGAESFGLIRVDESRRPAFDTWQTVIAHLNEVESAQLAQTGQVDAVLMRHSDGQMTLAAWSRTDEFAQIQVEATGEQSQLIDQYGNILTLRPLNGVYTLALPAATCNPMDGCAVGGSTSLLVQPAGEVMVTEITPTGLIPLEFK